MLLTNKKMNRLNYKKQCQRKKPNPKCFPICAPNPDHPESGQPHLEPAVMGESWGNTICPYAYAVGLVWLLLKKLMKRQKVANIKSNVTKVVKSQFSHSWSISVICDLVARFVNEFHFQQLGLQRTLSQENGWGWSQKTASRYCTDWKCAWGGMISNSWDMSLCLIFRY